MSLLSQVDVFYLTALRQVSFLKVILALVLGSSPFVIIISVLKPLHPKYTGLSTKRLVMLVALISHMTYLWLNFFSVWAMSDLLITYGQTLIVAVAMSVGVALANYLEKGRKREPSPPQLMLKLFGEQSLGIVVCRFNVDGADDSERVAWETLIPRKLIKRLRREYADELDRLVKKCIETTRLQPDFQLCDQFIGSHVEARQIGRTSGAKMVIWGRAVLIGKEIEICPNITVIGIALRDFIRSETDFPQVESVKITLEDLADGEYPPVLLDTPLEFAFVILSWVHILDGKLVAANEFLDRAVGRLDPADKSDREKKSNLLALKGLVELRNGRLAAATTSLKTATGWADHRPIVRFTLGLCFFFDALYELVETRQEEKKTIPIKGGRERIIAKRSRFDSLRKRPSPKVRLLESANAEFHRVQGKYRDFPYSYIFSSATNTILERTFKKSHNESAAKEYSQKSIRELELALEEAKKAKKLNEEGFLMIPSLLVSKYRETKRHERVTNVSRRYFQKMFPGAGIIMMRFFLLQIVNNPHVFRHIARTHLLATLIRIFTIIVLLASPRGRLIACLALNLDGWIRCRVNHLIRAAITFHFALLLNRFSICSLHNLLHVQFKKRHKTDRVEKKIARIRDKLATMPIERIVKYNSPWFILDPDDGGPAKLVRFQTLSQFDESTIRGNLARPVSAMPVDTRKIEGLRWFFQESLPDIYARSGGFEWT